MTIAIVPLAALTLLAAPASTPAPSGSCSITGVVRDAAGRPVPGLRVALAAASPARVTATDDAGRFELGAIDPASAARVVVSLAHRRTGRDVFVLYRDRAPIELSADARACSLDLDLRNPEGYDSALPREDWDDAFALYQGFAAGWRLAEELGVPVGTEPLEIAAWHSAASHDASFWVGTPSYLASAPRTALLGIGTAASRRDAGGAPDNREYHELGHHVLATALGALPRARGDTPHGGYFRNPTSADAWSEGFATFFAVMVAERIEQRADASRFRLDGARLDLEQDFRPWDLGGLEELAVAGALLDVVDGPSDAGEPEPALPAIASVARSDGGVVVVELEAITDAAPARVARLELHDAGGTARATVAVDPSVWQAPSAGPPRLPIALPDDLETAEITGAAWVASARADDDALQVPLADVWRAIVSYRSAQPESHGRLFDVADLYAALHAAVGDRRSDLDDVFVAHGLFADLDGDRELDPGETIGSTAHPERSLTVDGEATVWPAMLERRNVPTPAGLRVAISGAPARLYAQTMWPSARGRDIELTLTTIEDGHALVLPPPGGRDATVHLLADADDHQPAIVATWTADELHEVAAEHTTPTLSVEVALLAGEPSGRARVAGVRPLWLFIGGTVALALGLVLVVVGAIRARLA